MLPSTAGANLLRPQALLIALLALAASLAFVHPAYAARPTLGIAPLSYDVPNVSRGLTALLSRELAYGGRFTIVDPKLVEQALAAGGIGREDYASLPGKKLKELAGDFDYLLLGKVSVFDVSDKDVNIALNGALSDLGVKAGLGKKIAQVLIDFRLVKTADASEVMAFTAEGLESKRGIRLKDITIGYLGSVSIESDEFRQTNLGRAMYKVAGQVMRQLYDRFDMSGNVIAISGDAVVLDIDEQSGLRVGDELLVVHQTKIETPDGKTAWTEERRVGGVRVLKFQPGRALCLILDGLGAIEPGDVVHAVVERLSLPEEAESE